MTKVSARSDKKTTEINLCSISTENLHKQKLLHLSGQHLILLSTPPLLICIGITIGLLSNVGDPALDPE